MRQLQKLPKPAVLGQNETQWLAAFIDDPDDSTKRYRYRHPEIKSTLKKETWDKCAYCESKIGHNTPGDVEHKIPTSKAPQQHFTWENLTVACTECNRRKNNFYDEFDGFLDPYTDDVLEILEHNGPIVTWKVGNIRGEIFVLTLELCSAVRMQLVARKIEKIHQLQQTLERYEGTTNLALRELLKRQLRDMANASAEFSAMVLSALNGKGYGHLLQ